MMENNGKKESLEYVYNQYDRMLSYLEYAKEKYENALYYLGKNPLIIDGEEFDKGMIKKKYDALCLIEQKIKNKLFKLRGRIQTYPGKS